MADELIVPALEMLRQADPTEPADFVRQATERVAQAIVELQQKIAPPGTSAPRRAPTAATAAAPVTETPRQARWVQHKSVGSTGDAMRKSGGEKW
jgi:hypothetical protein